MAKNAKRKVSKKSKKKTVAKRKEIYTPLNDQLKLRFAQYYVQCADPTRAAVSAGVGVLNGEIDYDEAEEVGKRLQRSKLVERHLKFLNDKYRPDLRLDHSKFMDLLGEMVLVTVKDFLMDDLETGDYYLKPLYMLTQAELMSLKDIGQYQRMARNKDGISQVKSLNISLIDKTRIMEQYAKIAGFYGEGGGLDLDEMQRKLRDSMARIEFTDDERNTTLN